MAQPQPHAHPRLREPRVRLHPTQRCHAPLHVLPNLRPAAQGRVAPHADAYRNRPRLHHQPARAQDAAEHGRLPAPLQGAVLRYRSDRLRRHPHVLRQGQHLQQVLALHGHGCQGHRGRAARRLWLQAHHVGLLGPPRYPRLGVGQERADHGRLQEKGHCRLPRSHHWRCAERKASQPPPTTPPTSLVRPTSSLFSFYEGF